MLNRALAAIRTLAGFPVGERTFSSGFSWFAPGSRFDWTQKVGNVWDNSVASIGIGFLSRSWSQANLYACTTRPDGSEERLDHTFLRAVEEPNPWYDGPDLWAATILSLCTSGNAYWAVLKRQGVADPAFVYLAHDRVTPKSSSEAAIVDAYEYRAPGGTTVVLPSAGVLHFRHGIDPTDHKRGLSPLGALFRDIAVENMAATYAASILNRMGVPGMVFAPAQGAPPLSNEQRGQLKQSIEQVFTQDGAGTMLVMPVPGTVTFPGRSPQDMALSSMSQVPTDRILAALGLNGTALNLGTTHQTYNNYETALESAWEHGVLPLQALAARTIERFARTWYGDSNLSLRWDYRDVRALQPDMDRLAKRWEGLYRSDLVTRADARGQLGLEVDQERDDVFYSESTAGVRGEGAALMRAAGRLAQARRDTVEPGPEAGP